LAGLHEKKGGRKTKLSVDRFDDWLPAIVIADRITELTPHKDQRTPYLRVGELDLDVFRRKAGDRANTNSFESDSVAIVAARTARISGVDTPNVILAGQSVHITKGSGIGGTLILSGGAVTLDCDAEGCLIIAKDKVTCNHRLIECRIVSGKQIYTEMEPRDSVLSENELNPLGFIHWSDAPKEKPK
jgi:hypothetical protein